MSMFEPWQNKASASMVNGIPYTFHPSNGAPTGYPIVMNFSMLWSGRTGANPLYATGERAAFVHRFLSDELKRIDGSQHVVFRDGETRVHRAIIDDFIYEIQYGATADDCMKERPEWSMRALGPSGKMSTVNLELDAGTLLRNCPGNLWGSAEQKRRSAQLDIWLGYARAFDLAAYMTPQPLKELMRNPDIAF